MTERPAMKPCPFCGETEHTKLVEANIVCWVECGRPSCRAVGPRRETAITAINAWNSRSGDAIQTR
jgi:hypothetical protein